LSDCWSSWGPSASQKQKTVIPPYNIEKAGEDRYRIALAVAGFGEADLDVTAEGNVLTVTGKRPDAGTSQSMLYHGIASRSFVRRFSLAEHVVVKEAHLSNGLLVIELEQQIPEAMKPRRIAIGGDNKSRPDARKVA
jgi:molecular chaperone IbpA